MPTARQLVGVMIAIAIAATLFSPIQATVNENSGTVSVANETVVADAGNYTELQGYNIVANSETVWGYNDTASAYEQASSPGDYELDTDAGQLKVNSSSTLIDDGEDVKVSYDYEATGGTTTSLIVLIPLFVALLMLVTAASYITGAL